MQRKHCSLAAAQELVNYWSHIYLIVFFFEIVSRKLLNSTQANALNSLKENPFRCINCGKFTRKQRVFCGFFLHTLNFTRHKKRIRRRFFFFTFRLPLSMTMRFFPLLRYTLMHSLLHCKLRRALPGLQRRSRLHTLTSGVFVLTLCPERWQSSLFWISEYLQIKTQPRLKYERFLLG